MGELSNCTRCNKVFVKTYRPMCSDCVRAVEREFKLVYEFIRNKKNRESTILEVSESTEVSKDQIYEFIRQKRLTIKNNPNLGYPCELCGDLISEGKLCNSCKTNLDKEISDVYELDERKKQSNANDYHGYLK